MNILLIKKIGSTIAIIVSLATAYYALAKYHESVGYSKAVTEISRDSADKISEATDLAVKNAGVEIAKALRKQRDIFDAELLNTKQETIVETKIIEVLKDVEKIVYVDNCGKLNTDSIVLLNEGINQANSSTKN